MPFLLLKIEREQHVGYASILYIACDWRLVNSQTTGKSHIPPDENEKGMPIYDINITWLVFTYKVNFSVGLHIFNTPETHFHMILTYMIGL